MTQKACRDYFEEFSTKPTKVKHIRNEDRIKFMLTNPIIRTKLDEWLVTGNAPVVGDEDLNGTISNLNLAAATISKGPSPYNKNIEISLAKRKEGNGFYQKQKWGQSLDSYQTALRHSKFSKEDTKDAAICLANRSAVYFEMGKYDYALKDVDLAIANGYPERLRIKLIIRKANIFIKLKKFEDALAMVKLGQKNIAELPNDDESVNANNLEKLDKLEREICFKLNCPEEEQIIPPQSADDKDDLHKGFEDNPDFENASSCLSIQYSAESSRFVQASCDIKMGEMLFEEEPFASVLLPEYYEGYCHNCHIELNDYFFPCSNCTQVSYCSAICSTAAWKQNHSVECQSLQLLHSVGIAHLALRTVLTAGKEEILTTLKEEKQLANHRNFSVFRRGEPSYKRVFSLMDHTGDVQPEDLFQYCLTASLLTNFLKKKSRFLKGVLEDDVYRIGGVILRHICQLICNGHAVDSILTDINLQHISYSTMEDSQVKIATAIYPAVSLVNHSCDPNIACSFRSGRRLIVKAAMDLPKDSEVLNCYGPNFRRMNRKTRQENLKQQYFFSCKCVPCREESNGYSSFMEKFHAYSCAKCNGPIFASVSNPSFVGECNDCHESQNIKEKVENVFESDDHFSEGMTFLKNGNVGGAIQSLLTCYHLRSASLYEVNSDLGVVCDSLGRCYAIIGDFTKAVSFVQKSLSHVLERYGESSVEYAREIIKYADLLKASTEMDSNGFPSQDLIQKSKFILSLYT